jgi:hypothetical protein
MFWFLIVGVPSVIWFIKFNFNSTLSAKIILAIIFLVTYVILQLMINMSVIKSDTKVKKNK